ncbi:arginine N-succinyltransferase [Desulfobulbus sp. F4]|nr:arginine N-succinyltransferase [Desulfobulbus sp. F3]MCW5200267.1 arginine N-succinyltransferase [Desulfobulbus sp. F4]
MTALPPVSGRKGFSYKQVLAVAIGVMFLTSAGAVFAVKNWFFPQPFKPVVLDQQEEKQLEQKLAHLETASLAISNKPLSENVENPRLKPEPYTEEGANREIVFSEREINSLLATNTDFAEKIAVDFAENLVSLRLLLPIDPDFPVVGGKTLRLRAGAELAYRDRRPVVILKGVSLMGMPLPNAWLGGMKNIDLMQEFGGQPGFWQSLGDGVESIQVRDGELRLKLKE